MNLLIKAQSKFNNSFVRYEVVLPNGKTVGLYSALAHANTKEDSFMGINSLAISESFSKISTSWLDQPTKLVGKNKDVHISLNGEYWFTPKGDKELFKVRKQYGIKLEISDFDFMMALLPKGSKLIRKTTKKFNSAFIYEDEMQVVI